MCIRDRSDVEAFGPCGEDLAALMATGYPYLGIDRRCDRFETPCFPVEAVAGAVGSRLDAVSYTHLAVAPLPLRVARVVLQHAPEVQRREYVGA